MGVKGSVSDDGTTPPDRQAGGIRYRMAAGSAAVPLALAFLLGCAALKDRLGILGTRFSIAGLDVSHLVYPSDWLGASLDLVLPGRSFLGKFGVDVRADIKAANSNSRRAVFDGAIGHLRVGNTASSDPSAEGTIPPFSVGPGSDTVFPVTFPLRLDKPVFTKSAWKAIVKGEDIPYKIDAQLEFRLKGAEALGLPGKISAQPVELTVAKGSVNAKAAGSTAVERFLTLLDKVF